MPRRRRLLRLYLPVCTPFVATHHQYHMVVQAANSNRCFLRSSWVAPLTSLMNTVALLVLLQVRLIVVCSHHTGRTRAGKHGSFTRRD
mmetsp:Transcript_38037/g.117523  ORF Transcript_38037/g.117523 Transcript_38037/m.117523 type:complete len:88 (-) Transcript_38037:111-374(-)